MLSAIGICERCKVESGGVYFLLSYVLGSRIAAAVGLLYCFGQVIMIIYIDYILVYTIFILTGNPPCLNICFIAINSFKHLMIIFY